ncbi:mycofactocin system glycosyltransferase [Tamaricihabitans halophyticus]|uniref:Mycofactocin system glycosyltransferase n=1 Tax=Tamaricihabitans halophyticus TaxID=1262583 RepID=A0A4R2QVN0_9PSEU|nr:mycofactocin biosynthesis glycosyltransferase MftF [Tamaricihabitans halophyticus]TCP54123.1 mycofactocin system glycosyltransferase [Tamaricihabitans halophyticus]
MTRPAHLTPPPGLPGPPDARLPLGFAVRLDERVRRLAEDTVLGGSPPRVLRLHATARALFTGDRLVVRDRRGAALARRLLDAGLAHPLPSESLERPVSVVIPVRDRPTELRRLLAALQLPAAAELIVVDDGSTEPAAIAAAAHGALLLRHPHSRGPAAARNTGLAAAKHEFVAFLDSDVVPEPGWLGPLLAQFDDPSVALAAPRIVALPATPGALAEYERLRSSLDLGARPALIVPRSPVSYVPSAAMVVRAAAVADGFAEQLRVAEDVDLVCRLHAAGWRLRYEPAARVAHEHRTEFGPWLARKAFYGTGAAALALRHPQTVPPVNMPEWAALACVLLGTQRRWGALGAAALLGGNVLRTARSLRSMPAPMALSLRLNAQLTNGALAQAAHALTRHWWPLAVLGSLVSRRLRRLLLFAAVAEGIVDWLTHRDGATGTDPLRYLLLHRLDDLGYGYGLWLGALRARTSAPLRPRLVTARNRVL